MYSPNSLTIIVYASLISQTFAILNESKPVTHDPEFSLPKPQKYIIKESPSAHMLSGNRHLLDNFLPAEDIISRAGYPAEVHKIYAEDGQQLTLHRIPGPSRRSANSTNTRQPILIMHGLLGSSNIWLILPPSDALAFVLADEGYDVWLGNFRTNYYSRSHLKYSTKDKRFWDVSFHEMGLYDLPAMVDYIREVTSAPKLVYIGHSMGTTTFMIMASLRPEYNDKIAAAFLLSPVAITVRTNQLSPLIATFIHQADMLYEISKKLQLYEIFPRNEYVSNFLQASCGPSTLQPICLYVISHVLGENMVNLNLNDFGNFVSRGVAGVSIKAIHHYCQLFNAGKFQMYDYGREGNLDKYGKPTPPIYPLEKIKAPVYLYYGINDLVMNTEVTYQLAVALPNVIEINKAEDPKFNHVDYVIGNNVKRVVYDKLLKQIRKVSQDQ